MLTAAGRAALGGVVLIVVLIAVAACGSAAREVETPKPTVAVTSSSMSPPPEQPPPAASDWEVIAKSVQDRDIRVRSVGNGPRRVLFIGGIHGDEAEGAYATEQLPTAFLEAGLADAVTLTILEDANPDGRAAGTRTNANGVDVNRTFPAQNFDPANGGEPLSQPESRAVYELVKRVQPQLIIVSHAWSGKQFINFDGPAEPLAQRFSELSGLPVEASSGFAPTPGSFGSYFGRDQRIAVLTVEVLKGTDPVAVWDRLRPALLDVIKG